MMFRVDRTLGYFLKQIRLLHGFPQWVVAEYLKISSSTLSRYENDSLTPSVHILKQMSSFYKVSLDKLTGYYYEKHSHRVRGKKLYCNIEDTLNKLNKQRKED